MGWGWSRKLPGATFGAERRWYGGEVSVWILQLRRANMAIAGVLDASDFEPLRAVSDWLVNSYGEELEALLSTKTLSTISCV